MGSDSILIDAPATIRGFSPGGKGGFGYSSTTLHRLVERRRDADVAACGMTFTGSKIAVTDGAPKPAAAKRYGTCTKCWPEAK